jgi:AraC-like DNA-binding protein
MSWISRFDLAGPSNLDFRVMLPCAALRPFVRYYWILKCHGATPSTDEYLAPDGFEELIFSYTGRFRRTEIQGGQVAREVLERSYVVGCKTVGVNCLRLDDLGMVGVKLWPNSLHSLLGIPMGELRGRPLELRQLGDRKLLGLEARIFDADGEDAIKRVLDESLSPGDLARRSGGLVGNSIARIFEARGDIVIDDILKSQGRHYRTAERAFRERVGVAPKQLAKVIRFKHAHTTLGKGARRARGGLGPLDFGYYDASHFIRDFRQFTGTTPRDFLKSQPGFSTEIFNFCLDVDLHRLESRDAERGFALANARPSGRPAD